MEILQLSPKSVNLNKKIRSLSISQVRKKKIFKTIETESVESIKDYKNCFKQTIKLNTPTLKVVERKVKHRTVRRSFPIQRCNLVSAQNKEVYNDLSITLKSRFLAQKTFQNQMSPSPKIQFPQLSGSPKLSKMPQVSHILSKIKNSFNHFKKTHNSILQDFNI